MRKHTGVLSALIALALGLALSGCVPRTPEPSGGSTTPTINWSDPRTWTAADGRQLEGALVARMGADGVIQRKSDGRLVRMPASLLAPDAKTFLHDALAAGEIPATHGSAWFVKTRHTIPGGEAYVAPDSSVAIGPRIAKVETSYWLLLCELDLSRAFWARVDNHAFSQVRADTIIMRSDLATQVNGSGQFIDQVACPRPDLYIIDARYGLTSRRINVTRAIMGYIASGSLPLTVKPELFDLPPHIPDVWDVTITWQREGQGSLTRVIRDGSILAWPEANATR